MVSSDPRVEELRRKYESALREMENQEVHLIQISMRDDKLHIHGAAPSKQVLARIQNVLSGVDPEWHREVELNVHAPGELRPHTAQTGSASWKDPGISPQDRGHGVPRDAGNDQ